MKGMPKKATRKPGKGSASMRKKTSGKRGSESRSRPENHLKSNLVMCKDFLWFGSASLAVGAVFFFMTFITAMTLVRFFIAGFFLIIGFIDLILYIFLRER